jgi:hypothetical protein
MRAVLMASLPESEFFTPASSRRVARKPKHLNLWTGSAETWLPAQIWDLGAQAPPPEQLAVSVRRARPDLRARDLCPSIGIFQGLALYLA